MVRMLLPPARRFRFGLLLGLLPLLAFAGDRPAYRLFTAAGQPADYDQMLTELARPTWCSSASSTTTPWPTGWSCK